MEIIGAEYSYRTDAILHDGESATENMQGSSRHFKNSFHDFSG